MLGLVVGPGEVLGVGLVVVGVSVPMPPAAEPPDVSPVVPEEVPDEELSPEVPLDESDGMPDDVPDELSVELPDEVPEELPPEVSGVDPDVDPDSLVPLVSAGMPDGVPLLPVLPVELVPALESVPEPESPPVMPAQAPRSIAQAIGNIHFVIAHSRKVQRAVRAAVRTGELQYKCRE